MSHDRSPLVPGTVGPTGHFPDPRPSQESPEYTEAIRQAGDALRAVVHDLLDLSDIEAGPVGLEKAPFNPRVATEDILELLADAARRKGLELACWADESVPEVILGDAARFQQVLLHLVGNGLKHTEHGEVFVTLHATPAPGDTCKLRVEVRDSGPGLSAATGDRLLGKPLPSLGSAREPGLSRGLVIVRRLAEAMQGGLEGTSPSGQDSHFTFTGQFGVVSTPSAAPGSPPAALRGKKVLVVGDNETSRLVLHRLLSRWGAVVEEASTADIAWRKLAVSPIGAAAVDLAILDLRLPELSGIELAEKMREHPLWQKLPLILLGSGSYAARRAEGERLKARAVLARPLRQSALLRSLQDVWADAPAPAPAPSTPGAVAPAPSTPGAVAPAAASPAAPRPEGTPAIPVSRILIVEDNLTNQSLARRMIEKLGHQAEVVVNGLEAVSANQRARFDVILMDCQMPEMDGYTATRIIREGERKTGRHTPIIAMTANAAEGDREKCLEAGMDDYLTKPVRFSDLSLTINSWLTPVPSLSPHAT